jgi:hypothetical protein
MFIRSPGRLTSPQISTALGGMRDDDPRWLAVHQLLDEQLASAMLDVASPSCTNRDHAGGRVDELCTLKKRLMDARDVPLKPERPKQGKH